VVLSTGGAIIEEQIIGSEAGLLDPRVSAYAQRGALQGFLNATGFGFRRRLPDGRFQSFHFDPEMMDPSWGEARDLLFPVEGGLWLLSERGLFQVAEEGSWSFQEGVEAIHQDFNQQLWLSVEGSLRRGEESRPLPSWLLPVEEIQSDNTGGLWLAGQGALHLNLQGEVLTEAPAEIRYEHIQPLPGGSAWALSEGQLWRIEADGEAQREGAWDLYLSSLLPRGEGMWLGSYAGLYAAQSLEPGGVVLEFGTLPGVPGPPERVQLLRGEPGIWIGALSPEQILLSPSGDRLSQGPQTPGELRACQRSPAGQLWCITEEQLFSFQGGSWSPEGERIPGLLSLFVLEERILLLGAEDGLHRIDFIQNHHIYPPQAPQIQAIAADAQNIYVITPWGLLHLLDGSWLEIAEMEAQALALAPDGRLWIGGREGLYLRSPDGDFRRYESERIRGSIQALAAGDNGLLYLGDEQGLLRLQGQHLERLGLADNLPGVGVEQLLLEDGLLWVRAQRGIARLEHWP